MIKADLHMHGPIGFQTYWLKVQGYEGRNLLQLIVDSCLSNRLSICAITSEEKEIPRYSVHDRLMYLLNFVKDLPNDYYFDKLGNNLFVVEKNEDLLYLINGQTVIVKEGDLRFDHLVVGSNDVPNFMNLEDTLKYGKDNGLIQILEHPFAVNHFGIGAEKSEKYIKDYDCVEGHNSQFVIPSYLSWLPAIGKYNRKLNELAKKFALEHSKPSIATSDAHRIEDAGVSCIKFEDFTIKTTNEDEFLCSLRKIILDGKFSTVEKYLSFLDWLDWTSKFKKGISAGIN